MRVLARINPEALSRGNFVLVPELPGTGRLSMRVKTNKQGLWTKDFTKITIASLISLIGGEAMNLPLSLLVYDETGSTLLSAVMVVCGMLPDILFSVIAAPVIDRTSKKKWILSLDVCFMFVYAAMAYYTFTHPFHYAAYLIMVLVTGTLSVFYRLAYDAWYPDLIPVGLEQKGFAVSGMVANSVTVVMAPVAAFLYTVVPIHLVFSFVSISILIAILIEAGIREERRMIPVAEGNALTRYFNDLKEGFAYLKKEPGVRNIYMYMSISFGAGEGQYMLTRTFYQTSAVLNVTMFGFAASVGTMARLLSGLVLYKKEIPVKKRFTVVRIVYATIEALSASMLFLPYPFILADEALQGAMGNTSYTIRETAMKSYIPAEMRARLGAFFNMMICFSGIGFTMLAGWLGEIMPLRAAIVLISVMVFTSMIILICIPANDNRTIYEAVRE